MTDFHHNIFYYYSGASLKPSERGVQLEDNTTKALINTLKHSHPDVARKFLSWLGIEANDKPTFDLQKENIGISNIGSKSGRLLLGITQIKDDKSHFSDQGYVGNKGDGRPDAWIYGENYVVLIESKVGNNRLNANQMSSHGRKLGKHQTQNITWEEIYHFYKSLLGNQTLSPKDKWLIEQFMQYLEWNNMTTFTGFENAFFEYFITRDDANKKWVLDTIKAFADKITAELTQLDPLFYQSYDIGNLRVEDEGCWVGFGPTQPRKNEYRQWAHQTIGIDVNGLEILVNVELKDAMSLLRMRLDKQEMKFRKLLSEIPDIFFVHIEESKPKPKKPREFNNYKLATLECGFLKDPFSGLYGLKDMQSEGFNYIERLVKQAERPRLFVSRLLPRRKLIEFGEDGQALVTEVIQIMKAFHPLVAFINDEEKEYTHYRMKKAPKVDHIIPS